MNIAGVIEEVKALKTGYDLTDEQIIRFINLCEGLIMHGIVSGREGDADILLRCNGYNLDSDRETELFAPAPYDGIYAQYCAAQIDLLYEDGERYINDGAVFKNTFSDLRRWWRQGHRQKRNYGFHT